MHGGHLQNRAFASLGLARIPSPPVDEETRSFDSCCFYPSLDSYFATVEEPYLELSITMASSSKSGSLPTPEIGSRPARPFPVEYNKLMKAFAGVGEIEEVLRLFRELKESKSDPNVLCYNTVIDALVMGDRTQDAEALFEEMIELGVVLNLSSFNILVKLHSWCSKQFHLAYDVVRGMSRSGFHPDSTTYSTLIAGLCRSGRLEEALGVLDWMLEEKCAPTVYSYTPIVQGYCLDGRIEEARRLMATMETVGCPPNFVTYNILIKALCKIQQFDDVEKILDESELKGWKPNVVTYNTYLNGLVRAGKADEAFEKLVNVVGCGLEPTVVTLNILLDCLCRDSKVLEANCVLEWSSRLEWGVGVVGYNTVMSHLCNIGRSLAVLKLLSDMLKKGITPNTRTFNIAINSLCKIGKLEAAKCIVDSTGFAANVVTYNTLIHWFYAKGKGNEVQLLILDMGMKKIVPDIFTYAIMIDGLCRKGRFLEATDCFISSLENGDFLDLVYGLTYRLVKSQKLRELIYLVEGMGRKGFVPDFLVFNSLIRAFCSRGFCQSTEIHSLCLILDKWLTMR